MAQSIPKKFTLIDRKIFKKFAKMDGANFARLWVSRHDFNKHLRKRTKEGDIKDLRDYFLAAKEAFMHPKMVYLVHNRDTKLLYIGKKWVDILLGNGKIITSFKRKEPVESILKKERLHKLHISSIPQEQLQNERKRYKIKIKKG
jgi:hypothetical protein